MIREVERGTVIVLLMRPDSKRPSANVFCNVISQTFKTGFSKAGLPVMATNKHRKAACMLEDNFAHSTHTSICKMS